MWDGVFFNAFMAPPARKASSQERTCAEDRLPKMSTKGAPRLGASAIRKSKILLKKLAASERFLESLKFAPCLRARGIGNTKSLKKERFGRLFEIDESVSQ